MTKAKRVHVFKCPLCGKEMRLEEEDMALSRYFCTNFCCSWDFVPKETKEDRIEILDAEGNVGTVII